MKNKRILALLLAAVMCVSVLTGCGKDKDDSSSKKEDEKVQETYHEEFLELLDEIKEIKSGKMEADIKTIVSKDALESADEAVEEAADEESMSIDLEGFKESFDDFLDEDGNLQLSIGLDAEYDTEDEQYDIALEMFGGEFDILIDENEAYINIEGVLDTLGKLSGEDMSEFGSLFGDYKYLLTTVEDTETNEDEDEDEDKAETPDIKDYVTAENVSKKGDTYTLTLGSDYFEDAIDNESLESLESIGIKKIKDSSATVSVTKEDDEYTVEIEVNVENKITVELDFTLVSESVKIKLPDEDEVLDLNDMDSLFGFGYDEDYGYEIPEESTYPVDDSGFGYGEDDEDNDSSWSDWEASDTVEDLEIMYDFNIGNGKLSFVTDVTNVTEDNMAEIAGDLTSNTRTAIKEATPDKKVSEYTSSSTGDYPYYMTSFEVSGDFYQETIDYYLTDEYVSLTLSYNNIEPDVSDAELQILSERIKSLSGVDIPAEKLNEWIDYLVDSYDGIDDIISARTSYEIKDLDLSIYLWDGEEIDISLSVR